MIVVVVDILILLYDLEIVGTTNWDIATGILVFVIVVDVVIVVFVLSFLRMITFRKQRDFKTYMPMRCFKKLK